MKKSTNQLSLFDEPKAPAAKKVTPPVVARGKSAPSSLGNLLSKYQPKEKNKYISNEFQGYGVRLAMEFQDEAHKSLYIRLAKTVDRGILETARTFVIDSQAKSKAKLFMWKLKELRKELKEKKNSNVE